MYKIKGVTWTAVCRTFLWRRTRERYRNISDNVWPPSSEHRMAFRPGIRSFSLVLVILGVMAFCTLPANGNRQFIFAPMPNGGAVSANIGVVIQALEEHETNIHVLFPRISFGDQITLPPGSGPYNYPLPIPLIKQTTTDVIDSTVVLISDQDIKVISYNIAQYTSDAFSVVPMKYLGKEYFLALFSIMTSDEYSMGTVTVSALDKKARIEIFLNSTVQFQNVMYYKGDILRYTLRPFESLQLRPKYTNITGSRVVANTSVTITVGTDCANVPEDITDCDHLAEQLAPFEAWGVLYVLSPFPMRNSGYIFQIVAGLDSTMVRFHNGTTLELNMGDYITVDIPSQNMTFVSADKPISVIQYAKGQTSDNLAKTGPSMIRVIPIEQYVKSTVFPVQEANRMPTLTKIDSIYLEITSECKYLKNISVLQNYQPLSIEWIEEYSLTILNGTEMCSRWSVVTDGRYSVESERVITDEGQTIYPRFRAVVYAKGLYESYLYRAGSTDRTLNGISGSDSGTNTRHFQVLIKPHIVSIAATELVVSWVITEDGVGLFDRCTAFITGDTRARSVLINTEPPVSLSGLLPGTTYFIRINCSNNFGIHDWIDFPAETTLNAVPDRPSAPFDSVGGIGHYSFQVTVPPYTASTGQISCYEVIVVHLFNSSGNIDSDDDSYNDVSDYNIANNQIGIPFRVIVLKSLPVNNVITIGSVIERQSECNMADGHSEDDERTKRDARIVNSAILRATNGPLNPGGYYTCFLRVYSPTGGDGKFYYVNGPAMKPVQLMHVPDRSSEPFDSVGGIGHYSFEVTVPSYTTSTGQISCYEFIVVQLFNSSGNIDSDDDSYNDVSDYNITDNQIGTPFRVVVLKSLPIDYVITIGSVIETQSECNMADGHSEDDERTKRDARIVNSTILRATNGPLNPGGYYTCFLRVYSPTGEDGKFYYVNGPAMKPIQLKHLKDPHSGMNFTALGTSVSCILLIIIIIGIIIYRRKRSNGPAEKSAQGPTSV